MFVVYHDRLLKVHDFTRKPDGSTWLDLNIGYLVNYDKVDIVTLVTISEG